MQWMDLILASTVVGVELQCDYYGIQCRDLTLAAKNCDGVGQSVDAERFRNKRVHAV